MYIKSIYILFKMMYNQRILLILYELIIMLRKLSWIFCGLKPSYYLRHFILISPLTLFILLHTPLTDKATHTIINWHQVENFTFIFISWLLYPFSRFVYESVVGWLFGNNIFIVNSLIWLIAKLIIVGFCLTFAIVLAPIAWIYLFWYFKFGEGRGDYNCN